MVNKYLFCNYCNVSISKVIYSKKYGSITRGTTITSGNSVAGGKEWSSPSRIFFSYAAWRPALMVHEITATWRSR